LPEYALVLAILVAGACLAYVVAGSSASRVLQLAAVMAGRSSDIEPSNPANREAFDERLVADGRVATASDMSTGSTRNMATLLGIGAWVATMAGGLILLRFVRRKMAGDHSQLATDEPLVPELEPTAYDRLVEKRQQIFRMVTHDAENPGGVQTQVHHLMSRHLATVRPETPAAEAVSTMTSQGIRHLLVCEKSGRLVGIVSDRDLKNRAGATVAHIMTPTPVVVPPDMAVGSAITLMLSRSISCLPVVQHGQLCGVLTTTDVMLSCQCMLQVLEKMTAGLFLTDPSVGNRISPATWEQDSQELTTVTA
jgi:CBS-domain-containing membrane protein